MSKLFIRKFFCLCGLAFILAGCYREEIDILKSQVDDLRINDLEAMVSKMGTSVKDLLTLSDVLDPAVKELQQQKENILKEISAMQADMGQDEKDIEEMQAQIASLQAQLNSIEAAIEAINKANLSERIEELKKFVNSANSELSGRIDALAALQQTFATLDALSSLEAAVNAINAEVKRIQDSFDDEFLVALDRNKNEIISWISSESATIRKLFNDYYNKSQIDDMLDVLRAKDAAQDKDIKDMQERVDNLDSALRKAIEDAVNGSEKKLAERIDAIESDLQALTERVNGLEKRIEALEKLYDVIGDYKNYKGNLIDAIKALEKASADRQSETDQLAALLNTLKLLLTSSEGDYYDLSQIIADIAANSGITSDHEKRIAYLEELVGTLASVEALNGLGDQIKELREKLGDIDSKVKVNAEDIAELVRRVDAIVAKWSDEVFDQIQNNTEELAALKQKAIDLQAAIDQAVKDGQEADAKEREEVLGLIADINEAIAALIEREKLVEQGIKDVNEAVAKINELLEGCNVGEVKGLQNCLTNLDTRIKSLKDEADRIWAMIGSEELAIKGSLINAINILNARFGDLGGKTVKELIDALNADLAIINATIGDIKGGETTESLTSLKALIDKLNEELGKKADASSVEELKNAVADLQQGLKDFMSEYNDKLKDYLLKADAESTYATIEALNEYINYYTALVGELDVKVTEILGQVAALKLRIEAAENTVSGYNEKIGVIEGDIVKIKGIIGDGNFTNNWTDDLTAAVNKLHELVGDKSVADQATEIAKQQANLIAAGMVDDLIKAILGKDGTAADIKALLDSFASSITTLESRIKELAGMIGDISDLKDAENPDIATMIKNIKAVLAKLDETYAAKSHTHQLGDIEGLIDALNKLTGDLGTVSDKLNDLDEYVRVTLLGLINDLDKKFEGYTTPDAVRALISAAENILAGAIMNGGSDFNGYFASLNLTELQNRINAILNTDINNIIKDGGIIDSRAQALIDAALEALNIDDYLKKADFDTQIVEILKDYATNESVESAKAIAAAFATLKIALGDKEFSYDKFDEAVKYVYDQLQSKYSELYNDLQAHLGDINEAKQAFDGFKEAYNKFLENQFKDVKDRLDAIYPLIGGGFKDKTITEVIEEILGNISNIDLLINGIQDTLNGVVETEGKNSELISGLEATRDALISALFGGTILPEDGIPSGGYFADFEARISALKNTLEKIGFDTIKNDKGESLADVIGGINDAITSLKNTIGGDYSSSKTVAQALADFQEALKGFVTGSVYEEKVGGIENGLQALIDALTGKTGGTVDEVLSLSDLSTTIQALISRLDNFNSTTGKDIESFVKELYDRIAQIEEIVGDMEGTEFENLSKTVKDLYDYIYSPEFSGQIYQNAAEALKAKMGVTELLDMIGNTNDLNRNIQERGSLVEAINWLYGLTKNYVDAAALNQLKLEILGTSEYTSLKALEDAIKLLSDAIGRRPEGFTDKDIFAAIQRLENLINEKLGNSSGYETVWEAIDELLKMAEGEGGDANKTLNDILHSISFISDYADGKATIRHNSNRTDFSDLVMRFSVVAAPKFKTDLENGKYQISGLLREVATRAAGDEVPVNATATLSGGILTVTIKNEDLKQYMYSFTNAVSFSIAVVIKESQADGDMFITQYVPIYYTETTLKISSTLPSGLKYDSRTSTLTATSPFGGSYSGVFDTNAPALKISGADWVTLGANDNLVIAANEGNADRQQSLTVTADDGTGVSLSFTLIQECKKLTASYNNTVGTVFNVSASRNLRTITLGSNYGFDGTYTITGYTGNYDANPAVSGNSITFQTTYEWGSRQWAGGTIDVTASDGMTLHITLNRN